MFLTSLLKKISSGESKPTPEIVKPVIEENAVTINSSGNFPSWKDRSVWTTQCRLEPDIQSQCQEIKEIITGLLYKLFIKH